MFLFVKINYNIRYTALSKDQVTVLWLQIQQKNRSFERYFCLFFLSFSYYLEQPKVATITENAIPIMRDVILIAPRPDILEVKPINHAKP